MKGREGELCEAAKKGETEKVRALIESGADVTHFDGDGLTPLMHAAEHGHAPVLNILLSAGAPWNALSPSNLSAGDFAMQEGHQEAYELLLNAGIQAELVLGTIARKENKNTDTGHDYLEDRVSFSEDKLMDSDNKSVMMAWEKPLMEAHAKAVCSGGGHILNIGFGMGLVDTAIQQYSPVTHTIVEAHPEVYERMLSTGWGQKENVKIIFGRWQDVLSQLEIYDEATIVTTYKTLFTIFMMSTPNTSGTNSNSKIPSKFLSENITQDDYAPLWKYVSIVDKGSEGGGNKTWACNFCQKKFKSSYSRVKAHLLRIYGTGISVCSNVNEEYLAELKSIVELAANRVKPQHVPLPTEKAQESASLKRRKCGPLERAFNLEDRDHLKALIARMFYSSGLPFNLARNPYYVNSYLFAANHNISGFLPPGYNALRTTLLQQEKAHVERLLKPIKSTWKTKGVSIVSDGWTDSQRRPLINFMATSEGGPIFLKVVDASDEIKNKHYIADRMTEVIKEVGEENVVQVITDNAPVCKGAGMLIEVLFPKIFWTPCVVHTLNLALKNICAAKNTEKNEVAYAECNWITQVGEDVSFVRNFIMNHSMRLAIFNHFSPLKLLAVADTRFASIIVMLRRFKFLKRSLQSMVISEEWNSYRDDDKDKAQTVKEFILSDIWWDKIEYILDFTDPIYNMLRACDTDNPTLHLVYEMWDAMIEKVKTSIYRHEGKEPSDTSTFYQVVYSILIDRWTKSCTTLHCMAHSLNPRYYSDEWLREDSNRISPHEDEEISTERNKCLKKLFTTAEDRRKVALEYADFSSKANNFASFDSIEDRWTLDPKSWWVMHGSSAPLLQKLALKLLVQPTSSSCCERNWSTYSFIHSLKRNKLNPKRAEDLVYVHTNLRLLSRKSEEYKEGSTKMWDISGDAWDNFDGVGALEVASLSIDEPNIEAVLFTDDGQGGDEIDTIPIS